MRITSYGEGWKDGYHVYATDESGGEYIDKGKVGPFTIGDKVQDPTRSSMDRDGTILMAHVYPNGRIDYNVQFKYNRLQKSAKALEKKA